MSKTLNGYKIIEGVFENGSAALPSGRFIGGLTTGTYLSAANTLGFAANGASIGTWGVNTLTLTPAVATSGIPSAFVLTDAAHTTMAASTERIGANFNFSATKQWGTGAITTQREFLIQAPTYRFVGASTITSAGTFVVSGAPIAGTNATITNAYSIWSQSGTVRIDSGNGVNGLNIVSTNTTSAFYPLRIVSTTAGGQENIYLENTTATAVAGMALTNDQGRVAGFGNAGSTVGTPFSGNYVFYSSSSTAQDIIMLARNASGRFRIFAGGTAAGNEVITTSSTETIHPKNLIVGATAAGATAANGVLALGNGATAPTTSTDLAQLYAVDLSAGNATLGVFTERAVAADAAVVSTHTITVKWNGTNYRVLLAT